MIKKENFVWLKGKEKKEENNKIKITSIVFNNS